MSYYPNGCYESTGFYVDGKKEGFCRIYTRNGSIAFAGNFKDDLKYFCFFIKKRSGSGIKYYPNGKVEYQGKWLND